MWQTLVELEFSEWRHEPLSVTPKKEMFHLPLPPPPKGASYLDNIETGTVLGPSSNADSDQVLSILLQGDLPRHSGDSSGKKSKWQ